MGSDAVCGECNRQGRQVDGSREKVHAESPREGVSEMTILSLWGGELRVQHAYKAVLYTFS